MDIGTILGLVAVAILVRLAVGSLFKSWYSLKEGTGHEIDLEALQRGYSRPHGAIDPGTIERLERLLKEEAEREHPES